MEFAGKEYIYLSKLKKEKIQKIRKSEEENKDQAPGIKVEEKEDEKVEEKEDEKDEEKMILEEDEEHLGDEISKKLEKYNDRKKRRKLSNNSDNSDDVKLSVCSAEFDKDLEKSDSLSEDEEPAPMQKPAKKGHIFKKEIDTNICVIRYNSLENESENIVFKSYQCQKCQAYLNKHSNLVESNEKGKYEWKCEFCSEINKDLVINPKDIPINDCVETCIEPPIEIEKKTKDGNDSSLIFCFDISGSMCQSYNVGTELKEKFNRISGQKNKNKKNRFKLADDSDDDDFGFDYNQENTSYLSRLDLVKLSIENKWKKIIKRMK